MKKKFQQLKFLILAIVLGLGVNYVSAVWTGPTQAPPGGNRDVVVNNTTSDQKKGGTGVPTLPSLLDVEGSMSATNLAVWRNAVVSHDVYINTLPCTSTTCTNGPQPVCVDANHKLTIDCSGGGTSGRGSNVTSAQAALTTSQRGSNLIAFYASLNDVAPAGGVTVAVVATIEGGGKNGSTTTQQTGIVNIPEGQSMGGTITVTTYSSPTYQITNSCADPAGSTAGIGFATGVSC
jgi:hypothetical protein